MESLPPPVCQAVLLDGTFASLTEGRRSSIARIRALLDCEYGANPAPVRELRQLTKAGPVTLIYAARDAIHNNAVALRDYLDQPTANPAAP